MNECSVLNGTSIPSPRTFREQQEDWEESSKSWSKGGVSGLMSPGQERAAALCTALSSLLRTLSNSGYLYKTYNARSINSPSQRRGGEALPLKEDLWWPDDRHGEEKVLQPLLSCPYSVNDLCLMHLSAALINLTVSRKERPGDRKEEGLTGGGNIRGQWRINTARTHYGHGDSVGWIPLLCMISIC